MPKPLGVGAFKEDKGDGIVWGVGCEVFCDTEARLGVRTREGALVLRIVGLTCEEG